MKIVVWSGGADSTLILLDELLRTRGVGVVALTLEHPQINDAPQRALQSRARLAFKRWLRKTHQISFEHRQPQVLLPKECFAGRYVGQHGLFLAHLFPYMAPQGAEKVEVLFGYIRGDDHWHGRHEFRQAFSALADMAYAGPQMSLEYPLEWTRKEEVLDRLAKAKVPPEAWFTCDNPVAGKACGRCLKCDAVKPRPKPKRLETAKLRAVRIR